jgi:D-aspartate ligase
VFYSKYCRGKFVWRNDKTSRRETINHLLEIAKNKIGERAILVPYSDENVNLIVEYADELKDYFIFPNISPDTIRSVSSKRELHLLAKKHGIPTPEAFFPQSRSELEEYAKNAEFPLMLKPICSHSRVGGGSNFVVRTKDQLFKLYDQNEDVSNPNFFIQEYIPGNVESSWMFDGYFNEKSECLFGMTGKKVLQSPPEAGVTCIGVTEKNNQVLANSKRFLSTLGYKGMVDIDYRYDKRDGKYKILDVNPRIGLTFRLFVGNNDLDVMQTAYIDLTEQSIPSCQFVYGRKFLVEDSYFFNFATQLSPSKLAKNQSLKFFTGAQETAYFAPDDLNPFMMMCLRTASTLSKKFSGTKRKINLIGLGSGKSIHKHPA